MSLHNDINNLSNEIKQNYTRQLTKAELKEAEKLKKDRIKKIIHENLQYLFSFTKNIDDIEKLTSKLITNKAKNIEFVKECYFDKYKEKLKYSDIDYIFEFYYKFIQEVQKEYLYIYRIDERNRKEEKRQKEIAERAAQKEWIQKQKQKQIAYNNFIILLKSICWILAAPFLLIIFFVLGICKNIK